MASRTAPLGPVAYSGFPVRSLAGRIRARVTDSSGSGEWITAYQAEQKHRLRAVLSNSVQEAGSSLVLNPPTNTREVSGIARQRKALNRAFLLKHCFVNEPTDLCVCNVSSEALSDFNAEDCALFEGVVHVNASDNHLPFEAFDRFSSLEHLELSLNAIAEVTINIGSFSKLQFLDLSYNTLSGMALLALGTLPTVTELHLTGNNIVALPVEMSRPYATHGQNGTEHVLRFPGLERLWLDDNKLSDQATFATLAGLRKLTYLNLDGNEIYTIPQLKLIGTSPLKTTNPDERERQGEAEHAATGHDVDREIEEEEGKQCRTVGEKDSQTVAVESKSASAAYLLLQKTSEQHGTYFGDVDAPLSPASIQPSTVERQDDQSATPPQQGATPPIQHATPPTQLSTSIVQTHGETSHHSEPTSSPRGDLNPPGEFSTSHSSVATSSLAPFPCLETLSLVNNLILSAEGLLACGSWPSLNELIVHGNPLMRATRGIPLLLQTRLVREHGIRIVRRPLDSRKRHLIGTAAKDFKKVSVAPPPTIPKYPLQLALPAPPSSTPLILNHLPPSPQTHHVSFSPPPSLSPASASMQSLSDSPSLNSQSSVNSVSSETGQDCEGGRLGGGEGVEGEGVDPQEGVFMTQGAEEPTDITGKNKATSPRQPSLCQRQTSVQEEFSAWKRNLEEKHREAPKRYRGYEALLDTYDDPSVPIPTDVYGCTRALQYALKHPLVIAESKTAAPSRQSTGNYLKRKPSALTPSHPHLTASHPHLSARVTDVRAVLDEIKTRCVSLERNLGEILQPHSPPATVSRSSAELYQESRRLLTEMQARYDNVRASSLKTLRSASKHSAGSCLSRSEPHHI